MPEKLKFRVLQAIVLDRKARPGNELSKTTTPTQRRRDSQEGREAKITNLPRPPHPLGEAGPVRAGHGVQTKTFQNGLFYV